VGAPLTAEQVPNRDIDVNEDFVRKQEHLVLWLGNTLTRAMDSGKAVDSDAREAVETLIQSYRTLQSGLIYEARTATPYAAGLTDAIKTSVEDWRKQKPGCSATGRACAGRAGVFAKAGACNMRTGGGAGARF